MKRIISLMMVLIMLLSFSSVVFAEAVQSNRVTTTGEDIELLKEVISNMNEEEKALFLEMIQSSIEEQKIYKEHIDRNYRINYSLHSYNKSNTSGITTQSVAINLNYFNSQIAALELPRTAVMLFKAFGASLAAGVADGPLPFGDVAALLTGTITVAYVAANWDKIGPQWNKIVSIYTTTFSMIRSSVSRALSDFKDKVLDKVNASSGVTVSGRTITVNGTKYYCDERAEEAVYNMKRQRHYYYPAVLYRDEVWVASVEIDRNTALEILKFNSKVAGVFAISDSRARGLCSSLGQIRGPENHGAGSGYWDHYHAVSFKNAHCWFAGN